jgi:Outer membrane protein beta-barrel domain
MKKLFLSAALLFAALFSVKAQRGNNQICVAAEVGIPTGDFNTGFKTGFGGSVKGLFGFGNTGQFTLTTGYSEYKAKESTSEMSASIGIIPILAGYRLSMNGLYVEPQAGYGIYSAKIKYQGESASSSSGAFTYAAGIGYAKNKIDIGVRYQGATEDGDNIGLVGIHIGYNFSVGRSSQK